MKRITRWFAGAIVVAVGCLGATPAQAAGSNAGKNLIHTCGTITCSDYYSHAFTVGFDQWLQRAVEDRSVNEPAVAVCEVSGETIEMFELVAGGELIAVPCAVIHAAGVVTETVAEVIHHAATTNGCMRFRHPRGLNSVSIAVYADHGAICHSMDA